MTAVRAHRRGGPQELVVETVALPPLGPDEVLVAVHAAAITFTELEWDESWTHAPVIPGHEFSGVVEATGADVSTVEVGDPVFGLIRFDRQGAAADYVAVPARDISRKPRSLSHTETAALPLAALTAWQGLFDLAKVQPGERVLVLGGAGGVGAFAVQLAKHAGAFVTATARGAGVSFAGDMGADVVLDAENEELSSLGRTFDVVFDTIGGEALEASYATLMPRGRLVTLHAPPDKSLSARFQVESFFFIVSPDVGELDTLAGLADKGLLRVTLSASYPLEEARAAFAHASSPKHAPGKTVLVVRD